MESEFLIVHNSANDASAENEIAYMIRNDNEVSFHWAIDDIQAVQGIPENRNTWNAGDGGNGKGNRKGISIEICYSKSGGEKFEQAEKNAVKFIAMKLKEKGWGIDKVKKHQDFSNKYCPHRTLDLGWERFLDMIRAELEGQPVKNKVDVIYQTYTNGRWQPNVKNTEDYAGVFGLTVTGVYANLTRGNITYKVHTKKGRWLPEVTNRKDYAGILGKNIDGLMMKSDNGKLRYRVHLLNSDWLPWVTGYNRKDSNNGYAGILGREIDAIQIEIK